MNEIEKFILNSKDYSIISIVQTPLSNRIVIDHKPSTEELPHTWANYVMHKVSGTICIGSASSYQKDENNLIKKILMENPNFHISEDWNHIREWHISAGTIKELLSESYLDILVKECIAFDEKQVLKHSKWGLKEVRTYEYFKKCADEVIPQIIFDQLVRKSTSNHLKFVNDSFPSFAEFNDNYIMIVDGQHHGNCGFAPADAFLYKITKKEEIQKQNFFPYYNVHLQEPKKVKFKFLSGWETEQIITNSNKVNKKKEFIKININNNPAIIYE